MAERTVTTQAELDTALADDQVTTVYIDAPYGVWLRLESDSSSHVVARGSSHVVARGSSHVVARGSSHVVAWSSSHVEARDSSHVEALGSSHVEAWGSSHVEAWGSSHVVAWGSSHVVAWGSSHVEARDFSHVVAWSSSHVEARDSSHVVARDSSHVEARDFSHVVARDSSRVEARDSSHVVARDSSRVEARDSSHVVAWGSSHVEAGIAVAVHLHSSAVTISGGVVIDVTQMDLTDLRTWLAYAGVKVDDETGRARLFKAVDADLNAGHCHAITRYPIGETVTAPDWDPVQECGYGLHFGVSPAHALRYFQGTTDSGSARFLEVEVDAAGLVPLGDKAKAQSCLVVREVTLHGEPVEVTE